MNVSKRYEYVRKIYADLGIDIDSAVKQLAKIPISIHCWQGDDVSGFEGRSLSGGIAATGNYPGKAGNYLELMQDIECALSLVPGKHRLNLHANYAITEEPTDRNELKPAHFAKWVDFAKKHGMGLDFNPTFFSHPKADAATLSHYDEDIRRFWIDHGKASIKIAEYFANELNTYCHFNIWIPDGLKDIPADRYTPRKLLKSSLDEILADYDKQKVEVSVESKVFGIGLESYTVGSHEFYMNYAAKNNIMCLIDNGHYHPTENVADKIPSMLAFFDKMALHITRPVRWDSDHVVLFDDITRDIAREIIFCGADKVLIGLDFFDASINRVAAWVLGIRNLQKALLYALLTPFEKLSDLQKTQNKTELLVAQEELKTYPFGDVWDYFCEYCEVSVKDEWLNNVKAYERDYLSKRI